MQRVETPDGDRQPTRPPASPARPSRNAVSVALLAGMACVPIVVAAGFLMDRWEAAPVPGEISALALRGVIDGEAPARPRSTTRAGY